MYNLQFFCVSKNLDILLYLLFSSVLQHYIRHRLTRLMEQHRCIGTIIMFGCSAVLLLCLYDNFMVMFVFNSFFPCLKIKNCDIVILPYESNYPEINMSYKKQTY